MQKRDRVRRLSVPVRGGVQPGVFGVFAPIEFVTLQIQGVSSFEESSVAVRGGVQLGVLAFYDYERRGVRLGPPQGLKFRPPRPPGPSEKALSAWRRSSDLRFWGRVQIPGWEVRSRPGQLVLAEHCSAPLRTLNVPSHSTASDESPINHDLWSTNVDPTSHIAHPTSHRSQVQLNRQGLTVV